MVLPLLPLLPPPPRDIRLEFVVAKARDHAVPARDRLLLLSQSPDRFSLDLGIRLSFAEHCLGFPLPTLALEPGARLGDLADCPDRIVAEPFETLALNLSEPL
jgi:hypothetical protein